MWHYFNYFNPLTILTQRLPHLRKLLPVSFLSGLKGYFCYYLIVNYGLILLIIGVIVGMWYVWHVKKQELCLESIHPLYNTWLIVENVRSANTGSGCNWSYCRAVHHYLDHHHFCDAFQTSYGDRSLPYRITSFIYFPYLGFQKKKNGMARCAETLPQAASREWIDAGVFAVVAPPSSAHLFSKRMWSYSSMEKTLLVNDFLFVNKMSYGRVSANSTLVSVCAQYHAFFKNHSFLY